MQTIRAKKLATSISSRLSKRMDFREADNISRELLRHFHKTDRLDLSMNVTIEVSEETHQRVEDAINRLLLNEPLQHILGSVEFYGLEFKVDDRALIPRPETEELVDWIIESHPQPGLSILDIGTGTGCIPTTLAKRMRTASVSAIDVSTDALALARENALENKVSIQFEQKDILTSGLSTQYDIIISNPPYIPEDDKAVMSKNVLDYEPDLALFVPNHDPLLFYKRIASLALTHLASGGFLYFEIHENYGDAVLQLLKEQEFSDVVLKQDLQGKDRMVKATKI